MEIMKPSEENGPVAKRRRLQMESEVEESTQEKKFAPKVIMKSEINLVDLPYEIWLKILEYLSTKDILRNVARVSRKFHQISQDPFLVKRIELKSNMEEFEIWTRSKEKNYFADFFKVLKRSEKLTCLSLNLEWINKVEWMDPIFQLEKIIEQLPLLVNPQGLEEFCLKSSCDFQQFKGAGNILKYLDQCPNLKILKIDCFKSGNMGEIWKIISKFKFKNVKELHLTLRGQRCMVRASYNYSQPDALKRFLKHITENLPNIRLLWDQSFTSLMADLCEDINRVSSFSRCLNETFP